MILGYLLTRWKVKLSNFLQTSVFEINSNGAFHLKLMRKIGIKTFYKPSTMYKDCNEVMGYHKLIVIHRFLLITKNSKVRFGCWI